MKFHKKFHIKNLKKFLKKIFEDLSKLTLPNKISKCIIFAAVLSELLFLGVVILLVVPNRYIDVKPSVLCFLKKWKTYFFAASVCIWGFTLTCVIFLLGRLEEVYYGTSLKRIVIMSFGKAGVIVLVILYIILIPAMVLSYYLEMWSVNAWFQILNYVYTAGVIVFLSIISERRTVINLIRNTTITQMRKKKFYNEKYNDEHLAVLNMIRNLDYDDSWQCSMLQSIIVDMSITAIKKNRLYVMYNVIPLIIQYAGYETKGKRNRIINILSNINKDIIGEKKTKDIEDKKLREVVAAIIHPLLQMDVDATDGKWISQLIKELPWNMQRNVSIILIFGAEYLYNCGTFCKLTVDELIDTHLLLMNNDAAYTEEELSNDIWECWLNLNMYNYQGMQKDELYTAFVDDYKKIDTRLCATEILRDLQVRRLKETRKWTERISPDY